MEVVVVIIDDNEDINEHGLKFSLEDVYKNVMFFNNPLEAIKFIREDMLQNIIVLLDIEFSASEKLDGHGILEEIRNISSLIPVILWSGINQTEEEFSDFINNKAFGFISKDATIDEGMKVVRDAFIQLENSLDNTIEDWIITNPEDKTKPIYITADGTSFSLNDILREIRLQTETGKEFATKLNALTIDLLLRGKEKI